jgi:hypothetical protein
VGLEQLFMSYRQRDAKFGQGLVPSICEYPVLVVKQSLAWSITE